jgi:adenylate cyclase
MLWLRTFGGLSVEGPDGPEGGAASQRMPLALLALLAPAGPKGTSRDKLAGYLWPESPGGKVTHRLTQLLYALRRDLRADQLFLGTTELRLNPAIIRTDLQEFNRALEAGDFATAARTYGGPYLEGFFLDDAPEFEHWLDGERDRLAERFRAAVESLAENAGRRGDWPAAASWWQQLSQVDPLNSTAAVRSLEALDAVGDRVGALRFAKAYDARLRADFDLAVDPVVDAAVARLKQPAAPRVSTLPPVPAIAVVPVVNLMPEGENEYFSDGMTEELTIALTRVPGLRVASGISALRFKGKEDDPRQIAEQLGVSALVSGTVRKVGNRIRMTAQLVSGADGCQLWSETYDRTLDDVFALQEELARAIVAALPLTPDTGPAPLVRAPTAKVDAYTLYLRGRYSVLKRTAESLALAAEYFEQAIERDPRYALAHAGLAECRMFQGFPEIGEVPPLEVMPKAKAAALESLRLDPRLSEAHTWLGAIHFLFDWDWAEAEAEFRRALQLRPNNAWAEIWYSTLLVTMGRHEESIRRAIYAETLEPAAPQIRLAVPRCYYFARDYAAALESLEELWRAEPGREITAIWFSRVLCAMGRYGEALEWMNRIPIDRRSPYGESVLAASLAGLGRPNEALAIAQALQRKVDSGVYGPVPGLTGVYIRLGDQEAALDRLDRDYQSRVGFMPWLGTDPVYDGLRGHPRFEALLARMAFPGLPSSGATARAT